MAVMPLDPEKKMANARQLSGTYWPGKPHG